MHALWGSRTPFAHWPTEIPACFIPCIGMTHCSNADIQLLSYQPQRVLPADGVEVSPPGGILVRKAPGTAAIPFGQVISLGTAWVRRQGSRQASPELPESATRCTTMQAGGGRHMYQHQARHVGHSPEGSHPWDETTAWVTNMPDPLAAAEYLQRYD